MKMRQSLKKLRFWWRNNTNPIDWLRYRTWDKYHVVRCDGLTPGYYETEERMLHSMFGLLRDFVEIELASSYRSWHLRVYNGRLGRCREYGLAHLDWASTLVYDKSSGTYEEDEHYGKLTSQALAAIETKALYLWWADERPKRLDPMDESGCTAAHESLEKSGYEWFGKPFNGLSEWAPDKTGELYREFSRCAKLFHEIEERNHAEDETMMKRLVDIRRSMWT